MRLRDHISEEGMDVWMFVEVDPNASDVLLGDARMIIAHVNFACHFWLPALQEVKGDVPIWNRVFCRVCKHLVDIWMRRRSDSGSFVHYFYQAQVLYLLDKPQASFSFDKEDWYLHLRGGCASIKRERQCIVRIVDNDKAFGAGALRVHGLYCKFDIICSVSFSDHEATVDR